MYYISSTKISRMSAKVPLNLRDSSRKVTMIENKRYASQYIKVICHVTLLSNRTQAKLQVLGERRFRNSFAVFNRDNSFHSFIQLKRYKYILIFTTIYICCFFLKNIIFPFELYGILVVGSRLVCKFEYTYTIISQHNHNSTCDILVTKIFPAIILVFHLY